MTSKNDLFLRTRAEYLDCIRSGGLAFFLTFTYDEDNVPYYYYSLDDDGIISLTPCSRHEVTDNSNTLMTFNKSHITNYLKRVRDEIDRDYGSTGTLRYICVSEYGSQYTQRPHYHAIFFMHGDLVRLMFPDGLYGPLDNSNHLVCDLIMRRFGQQWPYGMVSASKAGLFVNSESCISYVTKYICKNSELLKFDRFSRFFDFICDAFNSPTPFLIPRRTFRESFDVFESVDSVLTSSWSRQIAVDVDYVKDDRYCGRLLVPHGHMFNSPMSFFLYYCRLFEICFYTVKSQYFGLSIIDDIDTSDPRELVNTLNKGIAHTSAKSGEVHYLNYPKYIVKKLFYNHRADGTYYLNECGLRTIDFLRYDSIVKSVQMVHDFDTSLLDSIPFNDLRIALQLPSNCKPTYVKTLFGKLFQNSEYVFAYDLFGRGRTFDAISYSELRELFYEYFDGRLKLFDFVRRASDLVIDHNPITYCLPSDSQTLGDFLESADDSRFFHFGFKKDYLFNGLAHLSDFWTFVSNYLRGSLLHEYMVESSAQKNLRDILNLRLYAVP